MGAAFVNIFNRMECLKRGVVGTFKQVEYLYAAFADISKRMECLKRGAASIFNRMEWSDAALVNKSKWMGCLKRRVASIFNRMVMLGVALAEWFHPEKRLGNALARDNHLSLSRKMPSPAISTSRYRENYPRPR